MGSWYSEDAVLHMHDVPGGLMITHYTAQGVLLFLINLGVARRRAETILSTGSYLDIICIL